MASNFDFLGEQFPELFNHATHTESIVYSAPRASCLYARFTLEQAVLWLYDYEGLDGVFNEDDADLIISIVRSFNETVDDPFRTVA